MRLFFFFILVISTNEKPIKFDLGAPEIQAVCKVILTYGEIKEGFITLGTGGYEYKYRLLDEMTIYVKLPLDLLVGYSSDDQNGKTTIDVERIKSIELLKKPSEKSIEIIENARKRQSESEKNEEWVDYQEPVWYHEIITDQKRIDYLSKFF
ncbi:hypothetical protein [Snuella sedimenti]|uniref:Uncharacterized protein n=1 Tax=Snuella sedimenti TaxID=2798802 RepID=A0A8J7J1D9_9FLAO|nr:hypothetical protein [Snuella sedimenti]MBJ6367867.1 hypothetical protein [Snuella sedimenti]